MKNRLYLILKKEPFDAIKNGTKKQEYRDLTDYYKNRLFDKLGNPIKFDCVLFRNGYSKDAESFEIEFISTKADKYGYIINLGKLL